MPKHRTKGRQMTPDEHYLTFGCKARNPDGSTLKLKRVLFREAIDVLTVYLQLNGTADMIDSDGNVYRIVNADGVLRLEKED